jgi:hypothetical protein
MRKTKRISLAALCASLGVIFLYLGSILDILDMSAAILASFLVLFCVLELGYGYAGMVYLVISVLALLLLPNKSPAILFAGLFGYVPITKFFFEKKMRKISWIPKLLVFNMIFAAVIFLGAELMGFTTDNTLGIPSIVFYVAYFILANVVCILCDILFTRLSRIYFYRFREKIHKYLK